MKGPPLGPGGEIITWPDQVAPRGRKASSTREIKPQTSDLCRHVVPFIPFIALIRTCLICVGVLSETVGFRVVCLDTF